MDQSAVLLSIIVIVFLVSHVLVYFLLRAYLDKKTRWLLLANISCLLLFSMYFQYFIIGSYFGIRSIFRRGPTEDMIGYASTIAANRKEELPADVKVSFKACRAYLNANSGKKINA